MKSMGLPGLADCLELDHSLDLVLRRFWDLTHAAMAALDQDQLDALGGILAQRQTCILQIEQMKSELQQAIESCFTAVQEEFGPAGHESVATALETLATARRTILSQIAAIDQELVRRSLQRKQTLLQDKNSPWQGRFNLEHELAGPKGVLFCSIG